jgi:molybdopterin/thiamine biosynthesis adenylyltransferase
MQHSVVAIAGVGDIGSRVAVAVVQSSVTRLAVADIDVVEFDNIGQSAFRSVDVGESKVDAIGVICREINPGVELRFCEADLQMVPELELGIWAGGAALLVLSLDDPRALLRLHDMFYGRVPMVAGGVHDGGASGHVVFTLPGKTACLRCALGVSGPNDLVQVRGNSASADDVQRVAGETASTVIAMLDPLRQRQLQANRNLLFITNRAGDGTQNRQSSWMEPERNPKCRVCGEGRRL